jgi:hypothetical protein
MFHCSAVLVATSQQMNNFVNQFHTLPNDTDLLHRGASCSTLNESPESGGGGCRCTTAKRIS